MHKNIIHVTLGLLILAVSSITCYSEETYILKRLVDIEQIRSEEQLEDDIPVVRIYIFLAVWNGSQYDTYTTSGKSDEGSDGETEMAEINNLDEYRNDTYPIKDMMQIEAEDHTCYINGLPNFEEIFPDEDDPFENDSLIDVDTSATADDEKRLTGSKSIPVVSDMGKREGIERFIAFYNKRGETEVEEESEDDVISFGFIEMKFQEE